MDDYYTKVKLHLCNIDRDSFLNKPEEFIETTFGVTKHLEHDPKAIYGMLFQRLAIMYSGIERMAPQAASIYKLMCSAFYELDNIESARLTPDMPHEEQEKALKQLDESRELYKSTLIKILGDAQKLQNAPIFAVNVFVCFIGRLIFEFNGYQAPPRFSISKAFDDAAGITNLYGEMLNDEILPLFKPPIFPKDPQ